MHENAQLQDQVKQEAKLLLA